MIKIFYLKYRIFIVPLSVGLICLIIIIFVIIPQIMEVFKEKGKVGELTSRIDLLDKKAAELQTLDEAKLKRDLTVALTILPTGRDVPQAMATLQDVITKSNLTLKSTSYSANTASSKASGQDSFALTISVAGSLSSTRDFLNNLREGSRIFKVESITLKTSPDGSLISVDLPLTVFYQSAPTTVLTLDQAVAKISSKDEELISKLSKFTFQEPIIATSSSSSSSSSSVPIGKQDLFN